ncbi:transcriptional regulator of acetoin/glycerol metabolism [Aeromicrobium panaciterrae]|uniref:Transcriptional regulator of acetoin/glycerol metabolism n=1 Tax=Aeromicrobium panaciterrae TaxID=363861 RepID=A0ABU1UKR8_9ACTN|nr:GAF domain-containing protein [Aeromicrobium panaciterrae]MDR7085769.1 transcriptional regulator of acetoin/glycerol metabolism [Aeromicrobium panaciterrae]
MVGKNDLAMPPGADPASLSRYLNEAHDEFVSTGQADPALRQLVLESWQRSVEGGLDPEQAMAAIRLDDAALAEIRDTHPLAAGMPVIRRLLVESAADAGLLVAVSDAAGQLLWVEGSASLRSRAESMHFVPGADWSENSAGTNAPGTALALDRPVQIFGPEHLARHVTPWSCSAAPIHDPDTGAVLGVLDLTGGAEVATPQSLTLVRATVAAVEAELRIERLSPSKPAVVSSGWSLPALDVLGGHGATLRHGSTTSRLSLRHSELLLLIAESPDGLTTADLGVALSEDEQATVTIRAEMSRLRSVLGPIELSSRPYRLKNAIDTDIARVRDDLARGQLRRAVATYRGPILPKSTAPAIERLRDELHMLVRSSLLTSDNADALLSFADTAHGRDDFEIWQRTLEVLPLTSPRYTQVAAHVAHLDEELG